MKLISNLLKYRYGSVSNGIKEMEKVYGRYFDKSLSNLSRNRKRDILLHFGISKESILEVLEILV